MPFSRVLINLPPLNDKTTSSIHFRTPVWSKSRPWSLILLTCSPCILTKNDRTGFGEWRSRSLGILTPVWLCWHPIDTINNFILECCVTLLSCHSLIALQIAWKNSLVCTFYLNFRTKTHFEFFCAKMVFEKVELMNFVSKNSFFKKIQNSKFEFLS